MDAHNDVIAGDERAVRISVAATACIPKDATVLTAFDGTPTGYVFKGHKYTFWLSLEKDDSEELSFADAELEGALTTLEYDEHRIEFVDGEGFEVAVGTGW